MSLWKVEKEKALLYFIIYNPHENQTRQLFKHSLTEEQLTLLRELAVNDHADNLQIDDPYDVKRLRRLKKILNKTLNKFMIGELPIRDTYKLLPIFSIWAYHTLLSHDVCEEISSRSHRPMA